ncbi:hypothetical protein CPLU01_01267 [Colletotrichum plurivorum]|uniref:Uncharacterized protein n=1 Tax=Colletotrichum plurivorum TaxID=2175906 RepID=A0A8H6NPQ2_9PEZI|nr:hypothetical protein CPLU01_01267 [Colletotrichum plurivorum]
MKEMEAAGRRHDPASGTPHAARRRSPEHDEWLVPITSAVGSDPGSGGSAEAGDQRWDDRLGERTRHTLASLPSEWEPAQITNLARLKAQGVRGAVGGRGGVCVAQVWLKMGEGRCPCGGPGYTEMLLVLLLLVLLRLEYEKAWACLEYMASWHQPNGRGVTGSSVSELSHVVRHRSGKASRPFVGTEFEDRAVEPGTRWREEGGGRREEGGGEEFGRVPREGARESRAWTDGRRGRTGGAGIVTETDDVAVNATASHDWMLLSPPVDKPPENGAHSPSAPDAPHPIASSHTLPSGQCLRRVCQPAARRSLAPSRGKTSSSAWGSLGFVAELSLCGARNALDACGGCSARGSAGHGEATVAGGHLRGHTASRLSTPRAIGLGHVAVDGVLALVTCHPVCLAVYLVQRMGDSDDNDNDKTLHGCLYGVVRRRGTGVTVLVRVKIVDVASPGEDLDGDKGAGETRNDWLGDFAGTLKARAREELLARGCKRLDEQPAMWRNPDDLESLLRISE